MIRSAAVAPAETLQLSATEIAGAVGAGELDPAALVRACMEEIESRYELSAVLARGYAAAIRRARRGVSGPLAGVPLIVSDTLDAAGLTTTLGLAFHRDRVPARSAAAVVALERAGAIVIGKANVDELGWGVTGENPNWGHAANPDHPGFASGGACGGAAAAVAARLCALALGADADGALRIPAGCCDTVAFKPAPGVVAAVGAHAFAPTFEAVGPMARTVRDCAVAYAVLAGEAPAAWAGPRRAGLRVGVVTGTPDLERVREVWPDAAEVELPRPRARVLPLLLLERALALRDIYPARRDELGAAAQARLDAAHAVRALDVHDARAALEEWRRRAAAEPAVDVIVTPALGAPVPARPEYGPGLDLSAGLDGGLGRYTLPVGLLGWPALAIGDLQIAGRDARAVLGAGLAYEEVFGPPS